MLYIEDLRSEIYNGKVVSVEGIVISKDTVKPFTESVTCRACNRKYPNGYNKKCTYCDNREFHPDFSKDLKDCGSITLADPYSEYENIPPLRVDVFGDSTKSSFWNSIKIGSKIIATGEIGFDVSESKKKFVLAFKLNATNLELEGNLEESEKKDFIIGYIKSRGSVNIDHNFYSKMKTFGISGDEIPLLMESLSKERKIEWISRDEIRIWSDSDEISMRIMALFKVGDQVDIKKILALPFKEEKIEQVLLFLRMENKIYSPSDGVYRRYGDLQ